MKDTSKSVLGTISLLGLVLAIAILHVGGWDNFKLRYFHLTSYLHDQKQELENIRAQNLNPTEYSRIDLAQLLNGGPPKDGIPSIDNPTLTMLKPHLSIDKKLWTDKKIIFPIRNQENLTSHPKTIISYIWETDTQTPKNNFSGSSHQFDHQTLQQIGEEIIEFNGRQIRAKWDRGLETVVVEEMEGTVILNSTAFAFVYPAYFHRSN